MSVYKVIELIGTSPSSWEDAAKNASKQAKKSLRHLIFIGGFLTWICFDNFILT